MNNLRTAHEEIQNGKWLRFENTGEELEGKTVGIIGFGNNGSAFAKKLLGFDVTVLAYDKYKTGYGDNFVREATLESILAKADVISFHVPQNIETIHYFNEEFLDQLHKPIYLLNLSRGKVVKTAAVVKGLKTGQIKGAGLDVLEYENSSFENFFQNELPADFEFILHAKNILLSPHVGGWSKESYFKLSKVLSDKIISFYFPEKLL
jgi:D-3-phosphoglycerate dehydrogenase